MDEGSGVQKYISRSTETPRNSSKTFIFVILETASRLENRIRISKIFRSIFFFFLILRLNQNTILDKFQTLCRFQNHFRKFLENSRIRERSSLFKTVSPWFVETMRFVRMIMHGRQRIIYLFVASLLRGR